MTGIQLYKLEFVLHLISHFVTASPKVEADDVSCNLRFVIWSITLVRQTKKAALTATSELIYTYKIEMTLDLSFFTLQSRVISVNS